MTVGGRFCQFVDGARITRKLPRVPLACCSKWIRYGLEGGRNIISDLIKTRTEVFMKSRGKYFRAFR